jgi:acyl dehydratase
MSAAFEKGELLPELRCAAVSRAQVEAYAIAAGDDNPIHIDEGIAHAAGLEGIVLPGMLVAAQFPRLLEAWAKPTRIVEFSVQFLAPLAVDRPFQVNGKVVAVTEAGDGAVVRMTARSGSNAVAMAEVRVVSG